MQLQNTWSCFFVGDRIYKILALNTSWTIIKWQKVHGTRAKSPQTKMPPIENLHANYNEELNR